MIKCCIRLWILDWTSIQPFILKLMVSLKGPFRLLRICFGCVMDIDERQLSAPKKKSVQIISEKFPLLSKRLFVGD